VDPISPLYSLAHLKLARVLANLGRTEKARAEYEALFQAWKDGDADLPPLMAATQEYARLPAKPQGVGVR